MSRAPYKDWKEQTEEQCELRQFLLKQNKEGRLETLYLICRFLKRIGYPWKGSGGLYWTHAIERANLNTLLGRNNEEEPSSCLPRA